MFRIAGGKRIADVEIAADSLAIELRDELPHLEWTEPKGVHQVNEAERTNVRGAE